MYFISKLVVAAATAAALVSANTITLVNQDDTNRHVVFTPSEGHAPIKSVDISADEQVKVHFPDGWIGNLYSVSEGAPDEPGMLAEVTFQGWMGLTYFDVSAIVNPNDHDGVKQLFPATQLTSKVKAAVSGCLVFPCGTAYYLPDDIQTVTTTETDLICTLGSTAEVESREVETKLVSRNYVLGKF